MYCTLKTSCYTFITMLYIPKNKILRYILLSLHCVQIQIICCLHKITWITKMHYLGVRLYCNWKVWIFSTYYAYACCWLMYWHNCFQSFHIFIMSFILNFLSMIYFSGCEASSADAFAVRYGTCNFNDASSAYRQSDYDPNFTSANGAIGMYIYYNGLYSYDYVQYDSKYIMLII